MERLIIFITVLITLFYSHNLFAKITVESTKGEVAYKKGTQWVPLTKGMELQEGVKISTGVKSSATLNIDGDTVTVDQLTMMKIFRNKQTSDQKNTHIGLKHGSLDARIKRIGQLKTSFKITTPVATSSVRGTKEKNFYGSKKGMKIHVPDGTAEGENPNGDTSLISGNLIFRMGPNDSKAGNLLSDEKKKSLVSIYDSNITDDEKGAHEFHGFDMLDNSENPDDFVPPSNSNSNQPASVNVIVEW